MQIMVIIWVKHMGLLNSVPILDSLKRLKYIADNFVEKFQKMKIYYQKSLFYNLTLLTKFFK